MAKQVPKAIAKRKGTVHNDFIELSKKGKLNPKASKVLAYLITRIDSCKDDEFKPIRIEAEDLQTLLGVRQNHVYGELREAAQNLATYSLEIPKGKGFVWTHIAKTYYEPGSGYATFTIDEDLRPYFLQLHNRGNFTSWELQVILQMSNPYSFPLYLLMRKGLFGGRDEYVFTIGIDELKRTIGCLKDSKESKGGIKFLYPNFNHFSTKVLQKVQQEFQTHSNIIFDFEPSEKKGRKILSLKFTVRENPGYNLPLPGMTSEIITKELSTPPDASEEPLAEENALQRKSENEASQKAWLYMLKMKDNRRDELAEEVREANKEIMIPSDQDIVDYLILNPDKMDV